MSCFQILEASYSDANLVLNIADCEAANEHRSFKPEDNVGACMYNAGSVDDISGSQ